MFENIQLNAGSHYEAKPCVASMRCIVNMICFLQCHQMQCNARIGSDSIFASAALCFTNQFSEFYHSTMVGTQGFVSLCELGL